MTIIPPFDRTSESIKRSLEHILANAPVLNLTVQEVLSTLRLIRLHVLLADRQYQDIYIHNNDIRLSQADNTDKFLALLLECEQRELILGTKRCITRFGGTKYHWRKIARDSAIVTTASAVSIDGGGYFGRGWVLAPNIATLRRWIVQTTQNPEIKKLKV